VGDWHWVFLFDLQLNRVGLVATIRGGIYRHFKGNRYLVISAAKHSETEESFVVYRRLYGNYDLWVRPLDNFLSTVDVNGEPVPRFSFERAATDDELHKYLLAFER